MLGHEFVMCDVDQQILFQKDLEGPRQDGGDDPRAVGRDGYLADEDTGLEIMLVEMLGEDSHLLDPHDGLGAEFDPDHPDRRRRRIGVGSGGKVGIFLYHGDSRAGRKRHFLATEAPLLEPAETSLVEVYGTKKEGGELTRAHR